MTLVELSAWALVILSISLDEFYAMEPVELHYCLQFQAEREQQKNELFIKTVYESMRVQTLRLLQANPYLKRTPKKLTDVFTFNWDKKQQTWQDMLQAFSSLSRNHNKSLKEK